jgi:hypothetical protein
VRIVGANPTTREMQSGLFISSMSLQYNMIVRVWHPPATSVTGVEAGSADSAAPTTAAERT